MPNKPNLNNGMARRPKKAAEPDMSPAYRRDEGTTEDKVKMTMWMPREWRTHLRLMAAKSDTDTMSSLILDALEQTYGTPDSPTN